MVVEHDVSLLVERLRKLPAETGWVEFKENNCDPKMIGEDVSALANTACYEGAGCAYMVWGVNDATHEVVGTTFDYRTEKVGNEEIENWLHHQLSLNASFRFDSAELDGKPVVVLTIDPAYFHTVDFQKCAYIRIGTYTKKLHDYPAVESAVWNTITKSDFESALAKGGLSIDDVLWLLDYPKYFDLLNMPIPRMQDETVRYLIEDGLVVRSDDGRFAITNLGAILFAKRLRDFPTVARKAPRIIQYHGTSRLEMLRERESMCGYACDYESMVEFVMALVPSHESVVGALREKTTAYPQIAVRELLANALIHQDLTLTGSGPLVEVFDGRVEFTNPGKPLVEVLRLLDNPPRSRNQALAGLMRRFHICEEAGTGWDKVIDACEFAHLPAPRVDVYSDGGGSTKVSLLAYAPYATMDANERVMACYWHACLCQMSNTAMGNQSLRARFGPEGPSPSSVSRLIRETIDRGLIKPVDPTSAPRFMRYVPAWA